MPGWLKSLFKCPARDPYDGMPCFRWRFHLGWHLGGVSGVKTASWSRRTQGTSTPRWVDGIPPERHPNVVGWKKAH